MKYCLIGRKLPHSYSAYIHKKSGLNYELKEIEPEDIENFIINGGYEGFNVTIPYKETVIDYLDEISPEAKAIGSVNTVAFKNGKHIGYNTDLKGLQYLFDRNKVELKGKKVLILGSGGTYKTASYLCEKNGAAKVEFVSRTGRINYNNCYDLSSDAEIIINCTPVGTYPNVFESPVDLSRFDKVEFVADCVYNPLKTALTVEAERLKIKNSNGLSMLVSQALYAEEIWTGDRKTDKTEMILSEIVKEKSNPVLFGMPSSGKTTIGKRLAEFYGREFIDTDEEIYKKTGKSPSDIIKDSGESVFRDIESDIIKEIAKKSGTVISVGGGAVIRKENVDALKMNGILLYVKRNLKFLTDKNRPLTQKYGAEKLFEERKDVYNGIKDAEIDNDSSVIDAVKKAVKEYENSCNKRC